MTPNNDSTTTTTTETTDSVNATAVLTKLVTTTVFDLDLFDDLKLAANVVIPPVPETLEDALAAVGNDTAKLLRVIHEGLIADAVDSAKESLQGFSVLNDDGSLGAPYTGNHANEEQGKKINAVVLSMAKMFAPSYKSLTKEQKREAKDKATEFLRANPAMFEALKNAQTSTPAETDETE